jgi:predicted dehydrogenase
MTTDTKKKITFVVVGGGHRGSGYAGYTLRHPEEGQAVAVCEPRDDRREAFAKTYGVPKNRCFRDWRELAEIPKVADAAMICTVEDLHRDIAVALADKGYHILLEKPMAPTAQACCDIVAAARRNGVVLAVCHVLRYVDYIRRMKDMLDSGLIGRIRHIAATELVGPWHFTHSFVRGNFRNEAQSSPFLLAKCCHDMDLLAWFVPSRCAKVSSFGRLSHFKRECQPVGAADRCTKCPPHIESACPYSALKIYLRDRIERLKLWPVSMLTTDATPAGVARALEEGPYGRCVYACDNDVADHQVVNLEFEDGTTAGFITTAFAVGSRDYFIMGERGSLRLNDDGMFHYDFLSGKKVQLPLHVGDASTSLSGHGGGDDGLVRDFLAAVRSGDKAAVTTGPEASLASHLIVFAAEKARKSGTVEPVPRLEG